MSKIPSNGIDESNDGELPEYGDLGISFDFIAFLERIRSGQGTAKDHDEFTIRAMQMFCLSVYANKKPQEWILHYFADQFMNILNGGLWCDELPLPWVPQSQIWTRAEHQGLRIYCDVENIMRNDPNRNKGEVLLEIADRYSTSYETARDQYYKWRNIIQKQDF